MASTAESKKDRQTHTKETQDGGTEEQRKPPTPSANTGIETKPQKQKQKHEGEEGRRPPRYKDREKEGQGGRGRQPADRPRKINTEPKHR